jgi:hypothetical protein
MTSLEVWSGGQTGVDRAAWDAARARGLPIAGWVPRGRRAEDGVIPSCYLGLQETPSHGYRQRTRWNVRDTNATLILYRGRLHGGSAYTLEQATRVNRPVLTVDLTGSAPGDDANRILTWWAEISGTRLNVAGPRSSTDPGVYDKARAVLDDVFGHLPE